MSGSLPYYSSVLTSGSFRLPKNSKPVLSELPAEQVAIVSTPGTLGGRPRIAGRRIAVQDIVVWHDQLGMSEAEIAREYKLTSHEIRAALNHYSENQKEIDDAIRVEDARITALNQRVSSRVRRGSGG